MSVTLPKSPEGPASVPNRSNRVRLIARRSKARRAAPVLLTAGALLLAACHDSPVLPPGEGPALSVHDTVQLLAEWFESASPRFLELPRTVLAGQDPETRRIVLGVEDSDAMASARGLMDSMGLPDWAYTLRVVPPIHFLSDSLRSRHRPVVAGLQVHFPGFVCTLGFNVEHAAGRSFVTNSHCTSDQGEMTGTVYHQPLSSVDPVAIAVEADDPTYFTGSPCPVGRRCRYSDASRVLYESGIESSRGTIAKPPSVNTGDLSVSDAFTIVSQDDESTSFAGTFEKVGRTTGWSRGDVTLTCVNINSAGKDITFLCQTLLGAPPGSVAGGDSGSPIFRILDGDDVELVGILWGGSQDGDVMVFSPLKNVVDELGGMTATASVVPPEPPLEVLANVVSGTRIDLEWTQASGALSYEVARRTRESAGWEALEVLGTSSDLTFEDLDAEPGSRYRHRVRACNSSSCSDWTLGPLVRTPVDAPSDLLAEAVSGTRIDLEWPAVPGAATYHVARRTRQGGGWGPIQSLGITSETLHIDTNVQPGTRYRHRVQACGPWGCSDWMLSPIVDTPVDAPAEVSASLVSGTQIDLSWPAVAGAQSYQIARRVRAEGVWGPVQHLATESGTSFTDTDIEPGLRYRHRVRACGSFGCSDWRLAPPIDVPE